MIHQNYTQKGFKEQLKFALNKQPTFKTNS